MTTYPSAPVDQQTADTLGLIAGDRVHRTDRQIITDAIETVAARSGGDVDPNELRAEITGLVYPNVIGATVSALVKQGRLKHSGWVVTTGSQSRNSGRPAKTYTYHP